MIWYMLGLVCLAGAVGGLFNALLAEQGLVQPTKVQQGDKKIYAPGFLGNMLTGAIAAGVSWGLYGPLSAHLILSISNVQETIQPPNIGLNLSSLVGAVLVGVGGARWLTNESEKTMLKQAASLAALAEPSPKAAREISVASAARTVEIAESLQKPDKKNAPGDDENFKTDDH